jgi:hypothetical protein
MVSENYAPTIDSDSENVVINAIHLRSSDMNRDSDNLQTRMKVKN